MQRLIFFLTIIGFFTFITFVVRLLIRTANQKIWQQRWLDRAAYYYPYLFLLSLILILASSTLGRQHIFMELSLTMGFVLLILSVALLLTSFFVFFIYFTGRLLGKMNPGAKTVSAKRRQVLRWTAAMAPAVLLSATGKGFAGAFSPVKVPVIPFSFSSLPEAFDGFRILHLSDLHLGYYFNLNDLEQLVARLRQQHFDLVLVTGDCADDVDQLTDALQLIDQIPARFPKFFSLGNHEYFRDLPRTLKILDRSPLELLRNASVELTYRGQKLRLMGIDDPVYMGRDIHPFLQQFLTEVSKRSNPQAFNVLMSHRPQALDLAPQFKVDLVLAGHTHGGQVGFNGRSVFENWGIHKYLWGKYKKGTSQLYTSAGVGHWLPFRLGCPPEAPIIVLRRADQK